MAADIVAHVFFTGMMIFGINSTSDEVMVLLPNGVVESHTDNYGHFLRHQPLLAFDCNDLMATAFATRDPKSGAIAIDKWNTISDSACQLPELNASSYFDNQEAQTGIDISLHWDIYFLPNGAVYRHSLKPLDCSFGNPKCSCSNKKTDFCDFGRLTKMADVQQDAGNAKASLFIQHLSDQDLSTVVGRIMMTSGLVGTNLDDAEDWNFVPPIVKQNTKGKDYIAGWDQAVTRTIAPAVRWDIDVPATSSDEPFIAVVLISPNTDKGFAMKLVLRRTNLAITISNLPNEKELCTIGARAASMHFPMLLAISDRDQSKRFNAIPYPKRNPEEGCLERESQRSAGVGAGKYPVICFNATMQGYDLP